MSLKFTYGSMDPINKKGIFLRVSLSLNYQDVPFPLIFLLSGVADDYFHAGVVLGL